MLNLMALLLAQFPQTGFRTTPPPDVGAGGAAALLGGVCFCPLLIFLLVIAFVVAGMWKIFEKAGEPGWAALIPIYNYMILAKIGGRDPLYGLLPLIPLVGIVFIIIIWMDVLKCFGKDTAYLIGLILLPIVFVPMLGFGDAQYQRPTGPPKQGLF